MSSRKYDVILLGATGFTGQLAANYLCKTEGLKWAIAGRNGEKLEKVVSGLEDVKSQPDVLVVSQTDQEKVNEMVAMTRALASTAGPFAKIGRGVVEACVKLGTDYCDITGEVPFVRQMMDKYGKLAEQNGTIICSCSGFDSVPSDLGSYYSVLKLREACGKDANVKNIRSYFVMKGGLSGGTLASGINMEKDPELYALMKDPFCLGGAPASGPRPGLDDDYDRAEFDDKIGSWIAPFGMATINTRIVRRSHSLMNYGDNFSYSEVSIAPNQKVAEKLARPGPPADKREKMMEAGRLPKPGQGPSKEMRAKSFFKTFVRAESEEGQSVWVKVSGGDPGYDETAKMLSEAVLSLAFDRSYLPGKKGGFLTPAAAFGTVLIERLNNNGIVFESIADPTTTAKL